MRRSASPSQDLLARPAVQIALVGILAFGGFLAPVLGVLRPGNAGRLLPWLVLAIAVFWLLWLGWTLLSWVLTLRMLRERTWVLLMVARSWHPGDAELDFPHDLLGLRQRWFPGLALRGTGLEVALTNAADGRPVVLWRLPRRWLPTLREAVRDAFGDKLELRDVPPELLPPAGRGRKTRMLLRPARRSEWPLRQLSERVDAKGRVARVLDEVDVAAGERLWILVNYLPVAPRGWLRAVRGMFADARQPRVEPLVWGGGRDPEERAFRGYEQRALASKIADQDPLFRLQVLVWAQGQDDSRRRGRVRDVRSAFDKWAGPNFFASPSLPRWLPGIRGFFDWMVRTGYNSSERLVAAWEALHFLLPWYGEQGGEVVRMSPAEELPPPQVALEGKGRVLCDV
jgi:hypothetical protein